MVSSVALQAGELLAAALLAGTVLVAVVAAPYLTAPPTTASDPVPSAREGRHGRGEATAETRPGADGTVHPAGLRQPRSAIGNEGTAIPVTEHGVMIAAPGHRPQVVPARQAEQVLAQAAPGMGSARPGRGERRWQL